MRLHNTFTNAQVVRFIGYVSQMIARDCGLTIEQAQWEVKNKIMLEGSCLRTKESYVTVSRVGAPFTLNRAKRLSIYLTVENALTHASFN